MSPAKSTDPSAVFWLSFWFLDNIGITLINKAAFAKVNFRYPYFLSAVHMFCNALGCRYVFYILYQERLKSSPQEDGELGGESSKKQQSEHWIVRLLGQIQRQELDASGKKLMLAFSVVFSLNIAIGNASLQYVSVNFNQVMRSLVPAMTIAMGWLMGKTTSLQKVFAVIPVIIGVAMACFGDMSYTTIGLTYTVACIILAALKVVASGEMLTGRNIKLHPVDLLGHMAPLALVQCLFLSVVTGEVASIRERWATDFDPTVNPYPMLVVWFSGIMSFSLNISSLQANKATSPLTLCIAANVKQVLMIILSTILFHVEVTTLNGAGIVVVLLGSAVYSYVLVLEKTKKESAAKVSPLPTSLKIAYESSDSSVSTVSLTSKGSTEFDSDIDSDEGEIEQEQAPLLSVLHSQQLEQKCPSFLVVR